MEHVFVCVCVSLANRKGNVRFGWLPSIVKCVIFASFPGKRWPMAHSRDVNERWCQLPSQQQFRVEESRRYLYFPRSVLYITRFDSSHDFLSARQSRTSVRHTRWSTKSNNQLLCSAAIPGNCCSVEYVTNENLRHSKLNFSFTLALTHKETHTETNSRKKCLLYYGFLLGRISNWITIYCMIDEKWAEKNWQKKTDRIIKNALIGKRKKN